VHANGAIISKAFVDKNWLRRTPGKLWLEVYAEIYYTSMQYKQHISNVLSFP